MLQLLQINTDEFWSQVRDTIFPAQSTSHRSHPGGRWPSNHNSFPCGWEAAPLRLLRHNWAPHSIPKGEHKLTLRDRVMLISGTCVCYLYLSVNTQSSWQEVRWGVDLWEKNYIQYWQVTDDGGSYSFQTRQNHGELVGVNLRNVSSLFCVIEVKWVFSE